MAEWNAYRTQLGAPPPQRSVGRMLDSTIELLQRAVETAKQINSNLHGFEPQEVVPPGGNPLVLSIHERANIAENTANQLVAALESILGGL